MGLSIFFLPWFYLHPRFPSLRICFATQLARCDRKNPAELPDFVIAAVIVCLFRVTVFKIFDPCFSFLLGIFHGLGDIVTHVVGFLLGRFLVRLTYLICSILRVTPSFLRGSLCLIDNP